MEIKSHEKLAINPKPGNLYISNTSLNLLFVMLPINFINKQFSLVQTLFSKIVSETNNICNVNTQENSSVVKIPQMIKEKKKQNSYNLQKTNSNILIDNNYGSIEYVNTDREFGDLREQEEQEYDQEQRAELLEELEFSNNKFDLQLLNLNKEGESKKSINFSIGTNFNSSKIVKNNVVNFGILHQTSNQSVDLLDILPIKNIHFFLKKEISINSESIGSGSFSKIKIAKYLNNEIPMALKQFKNFDFAKFKKEIIISKIYNHPNIPLIYGGLKHSKDLTNIDIVFEYIKGYTLDTYLQVFEKINKVSLIEKYLLMLDLCNVVDYIHLNNLIHRDLKPQNIMINTNKCVKLLDFGISRVTKNQFTMSKNAGTLIYMCPEYFPNINDTYENLYDSQTESLATESKYATNNNANSKIDYASNESDTLKFQISTKTDIWSLGCILNEVFSGELPWGECSKNISVVTSLLIKRTEFKVSKKIVDKELKSLIEKCVKIESSERISAKEVKSGLIKIMIKKIKEAGDLYAYFRKYNNEKETLALCNKILRFLLIQKSQLKNEPLRDYIKDTYEGKVLNMKGIERKDTDSKIAIVENGVDFSLISNNNNLNNTNNKNININNSNIVTKISNSYIDKPPEGLNINEKKMRVGKGLVKYSLEVAGSSANAKLQKHNSMLDVINDQSFLKLPVIQNTNKFTKNISSLGGSKNNQFLISRNNNENNNLLIDRRVKNSFKNSKNKYDFNFKPNVVLPNLNSINPKRFLINNDSSLKNPFSPSPNKNNQPNYQINKQKYNLKLVIRNTYDNNEKTRSLGSNGSNGINGNNGSIPKSISQLNVIKNKLPDNKDIKSPSFKSPGITSRKTNLNFNNFNQKSQEIVKKFKYPSPRNIFLKTKLSPNKQLVVHEQQKIDFNGDLMITHYQINR